MSKLWCKINKILKEDGRRILLQKVIDNLIAYSLYLLLSMSVLYFIIHLSKKLIDKFLNFEDSSNFPFILDFSEYLFLYSLPIFIIFGFINFYELQWKRQINNSNPPKSEAKESLTLSKKLFFSSLLSYLTLKLIELLFFKKEYDQISLIYILIFYFVIVVLVIIQSLKH